MFHAARNLQGEGVDVAVGWIKLEGRRGRGWIMDCQETLRVGLEKEEGLKKTTNVLEATCPSVCTWRGSRFFCLERGCSPPVR